MLGGPGVIEELTARGVSTVTPGEGREVGPVDAVVVGMFPGFDYAALAARGQGAPRRRAAHRHERGRHLPDSARDAPWRWDRLLSAVAVAGRAEPTVAGKPHPPTVGLVRANVGDVEIVVGTGLDRRSARPPAGDPLRASCSSGVTPHGHGRLDPEPDVEAPDLASLVRAERG